MTGNGNDSGRRYSVCMISDDFLPAATGVGTHIQLTARELARRGHRVSVITSRRPGEPSFEIIDGIRVHRTFTLKLFGFYQALAGRGSIRRILEQEQVDIIHYHYLSLLLINTYHAARGLPVKHLYTYHMTIEHLTQPLPMKPFKPLFFHLHVRYLNRFDLILAPSRNLIEQVKSFGVCTEIRYLSNPLSMELEELPVRQAPESRYVLLYVGRLNPEKNLPYLLNAFASLSSQVKNCELRIAGLGSQEGQLKALCEKLGIMDQVKFLGFLPHEILIQHYADADVFVLPSLIEAQPMVVIEAMKFSKPVILTRQMVSSRELVDDGVNGFIVDADSIDDMVNRLHQLWSDPGLRRRMGDASRSRSQGYSPSEIIGQLENHYASLLTS